MTITMKNVPRALHQALKKQAKANRRSLNQELVQRLEATFGPAALDTQAFLADLHQFQKRIAERGFKPMTQRQLKAAIEEGRE